MPLRSAHAFRMFSVEKLCCLHSQGAHGNQRAENLCFPIGSHVPGIGRLPEVRSSPGELPLASREGCEAMVADVAFDEGPLDLVALESRLLKQWCAELDRRGVVVDEKLEGAAGRLE